jgi:stearoyl-CoA desaturase (delta-9 desaturase)
MFRDSEFNIVTALTLIYLYSSILYIPFGYFEWEILVFGLFNFVWFGLGSSLYYHRCLTHRSFSLTPITEKFFLAGALIGLNGDPIKWVAMHRFHHQSSDQEVDPHSPKHGLFWSYAGWYMHHDYEKIDALKLKQAKDLLNIKHLNIWGNINYEGLPHVIYSFVFLYFFNVNFVILSIILPIILSYHFHWMLISSLCHKEELGYRKYEEVLDRSRNLPWLSFLSFGESLHNNHHKYPQCYNLSSSKSEYDFTGFVVELLGKFGLAKNLNKASYDE